MLRPEADSEEEQAQDAERAVARLEQLAEAHGEDREQQLNDDHDSQTPLPEKRSTTRPIGLVDVIWLCLGC